MDETTRNKLKLVLCSKSYSKEQCSVFMGDKRVQQYGRWLDEEGKCVYSLRKDHYCPYYTPEPKEQMTEKQLDNWNSWS